MSVIPKLYTFFLLTSLALSSCDWGRTPSKERFEKNCHIIIPQDVTVLKDEYEDMGSDYAIYYTLKFTPTSINNFRNSIIHSDYYNKYWRKSTHGYTFYKKIGDKDFTEYTIEVNTVSKIAEFQEGAN